MRGRLCLRFCLRLHLRLRLRRRHRHRLRFGRHLSRHLSRHRHLWMTGQEKAAAVPELVVMLRCDKHLP